MCGSEGGVRCIRAGVPCRNVNDGCGGDGPARVERMKRHQTSWWGDGWISGGDECMPCRLIYRLTSAGRGTDMTTKWPAGQRSGLRNTPRCCSEVREVREVRRIVGGDSSKGSRRRSSARLSGPGAAGSLRGDCQSAGSCTDKVCGPHQRRKRGRTATNVTGTQRYLNEHARRIVRLSCICSTACTACTACSGRCAVGSGSRGNAKLYPFVKLRFSGARRSLAPCVHL